MALVTLELIGRHVSFIRPALDGRFGGLFQPGTTFRCNTEGHGSGYWNTQGIRRSELFQPRDPKPILVMGDSFTEAMHVTDDEVYTSQMERTFQTAGMNIPVLNIGVSGCQLPLHIARAKNLKAAYSPRWTVIQVSRRSFCFGPQPTSPTRYVTNRVTGKMTIEMEHYPPLGKLSRINWQLRQYFALPGWIRYRFKDFCKGVKSEPPLFRAGSHRDKSPPNDASAPKVQSLGGKFTLAQELNLLAESFDHRLTVLYLAEFDPRAPSVASPFEIEVAAACRDQHISFVSLREEFPEFVRQGLSPYGFGNTNYNLGHSNPDGHRAMARVTCRELRRLMANALL